ncbi:hypothetical protein Tco_1182884 [Tanacetum coccineum]
MHPTFEKSPIAMTRKLDDMIELPKSQPKRTCNEDLEYELAMVKMPKCMSWLDYDEPIGDLDMVEDKVMIKAHKVPYKSSRHLREVPSFDEPEPQPLPNFLFLDFLQRITRISIDFLTPRYTLRVLRIILVILPEHSSDTIHSEDGNPVEPTSNKLIVGHSDIENMLEFDESNAYVLERFYTSAGNPIKEILLKLNLHVTGRSSQI